jgi:dolichol kinase
LGLFLAKNLPKRITPLFLFTPIIVLYALLLDALLPSRERRKEVNVLVGSYAMPYALCILLNTGRKFDEEGGAFGFVVPYPDISVVIGDDGINDGQS